MLYPKPKNMSFGQALESLEAGKMIARTEWNKNKSPNAQSFICPSDANANDWYEVTAT